MHLDLPAAPIFRSTAHVSRWDARDLQRRSHGTPSRPPELQRLIRGAFTTVEAWATLSERQRHVLLVLAALPRLPGGAVVSHLSAAAVMGWPHAGSWPTKVHAHDPTRRRLDDNAHTVLHPVPPDMVTVAGTGGSVAMCLTSPAMTAAAVARTLPFGHAVVMVDHALRSGCDRAEIARHVESIGHRGAARGHRVVAFASPLAASPGESLTRALLRTLGARTPVLQQRFSGPEGQVAEVDFWFPSEGVIVEFDGEVKYRDPAMLRGRTPLQAVIDEKRREDWLRALPQVRGVVRLRWADLFRPDVVAMRLRAAGLSLPA
ncbi:hypothetical protein [Curtobacterium sp. Leaf261]|uniref:hypothetical protein n=1 Tax=Curtobacterium sp. Leaf261 TaxID=1736311 RepID=UPI0006F42F4F|nr:hypothetical protein [Curtobacterium sp. Leaf261]KQO62225.1 hypothetical protein ASF23_10415 [Curtobacterium sp. Leaf261]